MPQHIKCMDVRGEIKSGELVVWIQRANNGRRLGGGAKITSAASGNRGGARLGRKSGSRSYSAAVRGMFFGELGVCHLAQSNTVCPAGKQGKQFGFPCLVCSLSPAELFFLLLAVEKVHPFRWSPSPFSTAESKREVLGNDFGDWIQKTSSVLKP